MAFVDQCFIKEGYAVHIQQATFTFDTAEAAQAAITAVWENSGYVRPTVGKDNSLDIVADTQAMAAIRAAVAPQYGAPQPVVGGSAEGEPGNEAAADNL